MALGHEVLSLPSLIYKFEFNTDNKIKKEFLTAGITLIVFCKNELKSTRKVLIAQNSFINIFVTVIQKPSPENLLLLPHEERMQTWEISIASACAVQRGCNINNF